MANAHQVGLFASERAARRNDEVSSLMGTNVLFRFEKLPIARQLQPQKPLTEDFARCTQIHSLQVFDDFTTVMGSSATSSATRVGVNTRTEVDGTTAR